MTAPVKPASTVSRRLLRGFVVVAVVIVIVRATSSYGPVLARLEHLGAGWLAVALALCVAYRIINAYGWVLVLRALGQRMEAAAGVRLWLVSETLRWLPGSVWSLFSRVSQAKAAGVPAVAASLSLPLELLLTISAWSLAACAGLGLSGVAGEWSGSVPASWLAAGGAGAALAVGALVAATRWAPSLAVSRKVRGLTDALMTLRACRPRFRWLMAAAVLFTGLCVLNGAAFLAVIRATSETRPGLLAAVGINAAGWLVGFFAFFAPAGLGVREGGMAAMLAPVMPLDAAIAAVVLWRVVQVVVELICLAGCFMPAGVSAVRRFVASTWAET